MARIFPEHFRRDGKAKKAYPDKQAAQTAADEVNERNPPWSQQRPYRCKFCGEYHLARFKKGQREAQTRKFT